jgi:hypothetical protein
MGTLKLFLDTWAFVENYVAKEERNPLKKTTYLRSLLIPTSFLTFIWSIYELIQISIKKFEFKNDQYIIVSNKYIIHTHLIPNNIDLMMYRTEDAKPFDEKPCLSILHRYACKWIYSFDKTDKFTFQLTYLFINENGQSLSKSSLPYSGYIKNLNNLIKDSEQILFHDITLHNVDIISIHLKISKII